MRYAAILLLALSACGTESTPARAMPRVLFVTQSVGYRHDVVTRPDPATLALAEVRLAAACRGRYHVDATQDASTIDATTLSRYAAVVFYTTGELPMPASSRAALLAWVRVGGAFVGIHSATDTFYAWPAYGAMLGAYFDGHPWHRKVRVRVEDRDHPATRHLRDGFEIVDEIYQFKDYDRSTLRVLLSLDVTSVDANAKGVNRTDGDFAVAWCKAYGGGRVFYTALGHRPEVWEDERFLEHVLGGIRWAISTTR